MNSGLQVKLSYQSLENSFVVTKKESKRSINYKNFESGFKILKDNTIISEGVIDKTFFINNSQYYSLNEGVMQQVWIDLEQSKNNFVVLNTSFYS